VPSPVGAYAAADIAGAIRGHAGESDFNVDKLVRLVEELNDNYMRKNTYAAQGLAGLFGCAVADAACLLLGVGLALVILRPCG
jgi:hypothetical protein